MAINLSSISTGKAQRAPRIVLLGREKTGKSTLASQSPAPIFLPIKGEQGIDDLDVAKFPTLKTFAEVIEALGSLATEAHDFKTVVIDSMSTLEPLVWDQTCADNPRDGVTPRSIEQVGGGFGKGYTEALKPWRQLSECLDYLREERGMSAILIGHTKVKPFNDPTAEAPYDQYQFDIHARAADLFYRWSDAIWFINRKAYSRTVAQQGDKKTVHGSGTGEPVLCTQSRPAHPGGGRGVFGRLPYELKPEWPAIEAAIAAVEAQRAGK